MKTIEKTMLVIGLVAMTGTLYAEGEDGVEASVGADVVSSYIWRGGKVDGAAIQPSISVGYKGLSLGAWGSASIVGSDYKEIDFTLSYAVGGFSAMVTDYWCASDDVDYFDYSDSTLTLLRSAWLTISNSFRLAGTPTSGAPWVPKRMATTPTHRTSRL